MNLINQAVVGDMQIEFIVAGIVCIFLLIYLTYTILYPEKY